MAFLRALSAAVIIAVALYVFLPFSGPPISVEESNFVVETAQSIPIPQLGLGTWLSDKDKVAQAVEYALKSGYDHIDSALIYRNEAETGGGIAAAGRRREDIWVTSKLWNYDHRPEEATAAIKKSLADLGLEYLDLYLIHWPVAFVPGEGTKLDKDVTLVDTWRVLENLVRANLTRYIGVSNFAKKDVETILEIATIKPYAHEFETHPYLQQQDFVDFHKEIGVKVIAYSPFGNTNPTYNGRHKDLPSLFKNPFWVELAKTKNATVPQTVLAWGLQRGTTVIPKSANLKHIEENKVALDIEFTDEEFKAIAKEDKKARFSNPGKNWGADLFADLDDPTILEGSSDEL